MELHGLSAEQRLDGPLGAYLRVGSGGNSALPVTNSSHDGQHTVTGSAKDGSTLVSETMADQRLASSSKNRFQQGVGIGGHLAENLAGVEGSSDVGTVKEGDGARETNAADSTGKEGLRPTVVRVKRRRTESPLDALMLEVATRTGSDQALDQAIARLAVNEQQTSRKLFRRFETVSAADLRERNAGAAILQRLSKLRQTECEQAECEQGYQISVSNRPVVESFDRSPTQATDALSRRTETDVEEQPETRDLPDSVHGPVFEAADEIRAQNSHLNKRSPAKERLQTYGRSKEEVLGDDLRRTRQQGLLTSARAGRLEAASAARYEQVRVRREAADPMGELFRLYDVIRVDDDERERRAAQREERKRAAREATSRRALLMNYLPLLREVVPNAAAPATWQDDIDSSDEDDVSAGGDVSDGDEYVYDVYALEEGAAENGQREADELHPVIRVADDLDMRPTDEAASDYDSEDSNDENNPDNDYPEDEFGEGVDVASEASSQDDSDVEVYENDDEEFDVTAYDEDDSDDEGMRVGRASSWAMRR